MRLRIPFRTVAAQALKAMYRQDFEAIAPRYAVLGTPEQCMDRLHQFYQAGATHIVLVLLGDSEGRQSRLETLAEKVIPEVRKFQ